MIPESPKSRFLKSSLAAGHAKLVAQPDFQTVLDAALLQMQWGATSQALGDASATQLRFEGAQSFYRILMTLADKTPDRPQTKGDNLPHQ